MTQELRLVRRHLPFTIERSDWRATIVALAQVAYGVDTRPFPSPVHKKRMVKGRLRQTKLRYPYPDVLYDIRHLDTIYRLFDIQVPPSYVLYLYLNYPFLPLFPARERRGRKESPFQASSRFCFLFHTTKGRSTPDAILQSIAPTPYLLLLTRPINTIFTSLSVVKQRSLPVCTLVPYY